MPADLNDMTDDMEGQGRRRLSEFADRARDSFSGGVERLRTSSRDLTGRSREQLRHAGDFVDEQIHERPLALAAGALAAGVVIGLLIAAGSRR